MAMTMMPDDLNRFIGLAPCAGGVVFMAFLDLGQRQIGNHALALAALDDDLVRFLQDVFEGFEEDALARHILGILVLLIDLEEALRFALRLEHDARLVALGIFDDLGRLALHQAAALIGILVGFVDRAGLVLLGALHLFEGIEHFRRRVGLFELEAGDEDAGRIAVKRRLRDAHDLVLGGETAGGADFLGRRAPDDLAHGAFGDAL